MTNRSVTPSAPLVGMVVNYYCKHREFEHKGVVTDCTKLGLRFLSMCESIGSIILVDGSSTPDPVLQEHCAKLSVRYLHTGKQLSYVEAYNIGWRSLDEEVVGLMANDILPYPVDTITRLLDYLLKPGIGCVFPYLSSSQIRGDEVQQRGFLNRINVTCEPGSMTLNLNLFKRQVLEEINGLDESFQFGFQEPLLLIKIRSLGWRTLLVGETHAFHCEQLTKMVGASSLTTEDYEKDINRWFGEYRNYAALHGPGYLALWRRPLATTRIAAALWWMVIHTPWERLRKPGLRFAMWMEPWLTRYARSRPGISSQKSLEQDRLANQIANLSESSTQVFRVRIRADGHIVTSREEVDFWRVRVYDHGGREVFRQDFDAQMVRDILALDDPQFLFKYRARKPGIKWGIQPHTQKGAVLDEVTGDC